MKKKRRKTPGEYVFFDRDLSWLSFNERVLNEAERGSVPLMERIRFLAIFSSNLDEFYRVRMPTLMALNGLQRENETGDVEALLPTIREKVLRLQEHFGRIMENQILHELRNNRIHLVYKEPPPDVIRESLMRYFIYEVAAFIRIVNLARDHRFFPENNKLYMVVTTKAKEEANHYIVNIPSDVLPRFHMLAAGDTQYIVFLDDIVKINLSRIFNGQEVVACHSFKITRDAELDLEDEFRGNLARKIEKKISERDLGLATRFLYEPGISKATLRRVREELNLKGANLISGGVYHNLRDLFTLPVTDSKLFYEAWPTINVGVGTYVSLFQEITSRDILLHPPYNNFDVVIRFFNEAAIDPSVERIYVTLYRVASDSRIASALISAAGNGKDVTVFVELKARFDEANNIRWSKKMKAAGVKIIESIPGLKVHAKVALIKRRNGKKANLLGLLATGNFNESTARLYTDHILMTGHAAMLKEMEKLFRVLKKRRKPAGRGKDVFRHLLVGQFNLQQRFLDLVDREIGHAEKGLPAAITIKFNNLEDRVLISRLYDASRAGVKISLIVRGICCLVPGVPGMSENISVKRIVDRYLEHGRVFIFHNKGEPEVYLGSADWMNRNIYRRIEVCFPVYDGSLKSEVINLIELQWNDNCQAVTIDDQCRNVAVASNHEMNGLIRSQRMISEILSGNIEQRKPKVESG